MKTRIAVAILWIGILASSGARGQSGASSPFQVVQGKSYKFEKVAEGVYYATGGVGGNHPIIVNDDEVLLVDTGTTPATARDLLEDLKLITNKPVRYVVNTHFHYDHTDGNQIFGPDVQIIAHEFVRTAITTFDVMHREPYLTSQGTRLPPLIESLKKQIADEKDAAKRSALEKDLAEAQTLWQQLQEVKPTPPNVTYSSKLVLNRGQREIQILFLGRGHTAGDTFVYLPKEKIICTGDMMESQVAFMGDAFFDEWVATMGALKNMDFTLVLPGHGVPFRDKGLISAWQGYLNDIVKQADQMRQQGVSPEDAAKRVNLTAYAKDFPNIPGIGADQRGVRRIYQWLGERGK